MSGETIPLVCEWKTNDPGLADMLNMIERIPRFSALREEMLGHLHMQVASLHFKHAGEYAARDRDRDIRQQRRQEKT